MKRLLFVVNSLNGGGAEKALLTLLRILKEEGYDITILLIEKEGVHIKEAEKEFKVLNIFKKRSFLNKIMILKKINSAYRIYLIKYFYKYILEKKLQNNYDVVISFLEGVSTELISRIKSIKKIAWIHTDLSKNNVHFNLKEQKKMYKEIDKIVCVSNDTKKNFLSLHPYYKEKVSVIYNYIDKNEIINKSIEEKIAKNEDLIKIISVGRLSKEKGHNLLLEALSQISLPDKNYKIEILGEGIEREKYEKYILDNNLCNKIKLLGFKKNPYPYIKSADILIMPSYYEGYPLVLCEAMILGKAIISSDCGSATEILENGKYGVLFKKGDSLDLRYQIEKMVNTVGNIKLYSNLSKLGSQNFDKEKILKNIKNLFEN